jgi:hypothetical protein
MCVILGMDKINDFFWLPFDFHFWFLIFDFDLTHF